MTTPYDPENLSVLIIDDEVFMRQLINRVLMEIGIQNIASAKNGREGLNMVKDPGRQFDIILCDLQMPGMDGFEFVKHLRRLGAVSKPDTPVLIITGHSDEDHIKEAVRAGINGFLVKPISKANLETRIKAALKGVRIDPGVLG